LDDVIQYMRDLKLLYKDRFFNFNDDNLFGNRPYFIDLLKRMCKLNIQWAGQVSSNVAKDETVMKLMAESGCNTLFVGLESISNESLKSINKKMNKTEEYHFFMEQCEKLGIRVVISIIFGLDGDDESSFRKTVDFVNQYKWLTPSYTILTPFPGSRMYERLKTENRIIDFDWRHYDLGHVVIQPKQMSPGTLKEGFHWAQSQFETYLMSVEDVSKERMGLSTRLRKE